MDIIYVTLNNTKEAKLLGKELLEKKLANCVNYFPITCMYNYHDEITEEPEVVMIIKTKAAQYKKIHDLIKKHITYDNFIGQFKVDQINNEFKNWLDSIVG